MSPTFEERKAARIVAEREKVLDQINPQNLIKNVRTAVSELIEQERELAALETSYGWNEVDNRREKAEKKYKAALDTLSEFIDHHVKKHSSSS